MDERAPFKLKMPNTKGISLHKLIKKRVPHECYYLQDFRGDEPITFERWARKIEGLMKEAKISGGLSTFVQEDPLNLQIEDLVKCSSSYMKRTSVGDGETRAQRQALM